MPRIFRSPEKKYRSFPKAQRPRSPSPKRKDYRAASLKASDGHSKCTYVSPTTNKRCKNTLGVYPEFCWLHTMKIRNLVVGPSNVPFGGFGLFAGPEGFRKGDVIAEYSNAHNKVSLGTLEKRCQHVGEKCWDYVFCDNEQKNSKATTCWDGYDIRSTVARYANDAHGTVFRNNAYFDVRGKHVYMMASRNIRGGSEILCSYGDMYW